MCEGSGQKHEGQVGRDVEVDVAGDRWSISTAVEGEGE